MSDAGKRVIGRRVERFEEQTQPGDFRWAAFENGQPARIMFRCPCGCGDMFGAVCQPAVAEGWIFSGTLDRPTLRPSLDFKDKTDPTCRRSHWHGYLTDGVFTHC